MSLSQQDVALVKGMLIRGDFQHDIAAYFSENPARIAEIKNGEKFNSIKAAEPKTLPSLEKTGRFIDPKAPAEKQYEQLQTFINRPPEGSRILVLSPGLNELVLERLNTNNRSKRPGNIKRFATAIATGNWIITGDTVKFSKKGFLLDGQNRLASSVRSQKSIKTHVVFGIADDAFDRIDANAVRSNTDTFRIAGIANPKVSAPAVRWLMIETDRGRKVDNPELLLYLQEHVDEDRLNICVNHAIEIGLVLPRGPLAALLYRFSEKHSKLSERFAADLKANKGNGKKLLDRIKELKKQNAGRVHELKQCALIIIAWNAYRSNAALTKTVLKWDDAKEFPTIA